MPSLLESFDPAGQKAAAAAAPAGPHRVGIAFALVCMAGMCAPLGAAVVIFMSRSHTRLLAASIALAAGVMIFVSLTEVLNESTAEVETTGLAPALVQLITYSGFIGGLLSCWALDVLTDVCLKLINRTKTEAAPDKGVLERMPSGRMRDLPLELKDGAGNELEIAQGGEATGGHIVVEGMLQDAAEAMDGSDNYKDLLRTSILILIALAVHNLPEGLATFVGYMSSPHVGVTIAVAIAIHNIPEGIAIGVPMFFATGSRWKAILWAGVSGLAEPVGALIGLAVHSSGRLSPLGMGIILAGTAGIMTGIAVRELIPRSMYYDPSNKCTTHGTFAGMVVMAISLILITLLDKGE